MSHTPLGNKHTRIERTIKLKQNQGGCAFSLSVTTVKVVLQYLFKKKTCKLLHTNVTTHSFLSSHIHVQLSRAAICLNLAEHNRQARKL